MSFPVRMVSAAASRWHGAATGAATGAAGRRALSDGRTPPHLCERDEWDVMRTGGCGEMEQRTRATRLNKTTYKWR